MFRAGDVVSVKTINEKWVLACDEEDGEVICAGWPESRTPTSNVELVRAATDEQRLQMLRDVAQRRDASSTRERRAKRQLEALEAPISA